MSGWLQVIAGRDRPCEACKRTVESGDECWVRHRGDEVLVRCERCPPTDDDPQPG